MLSDIYLSVCLSVLSVTLVYCGQTVGWIKMKPGTEVGLGPGDIVLDGDPTPSPKKGGTAPPILAHVLWPNNCLDQAATWYGGWPRPRPHCHMGPTYPKKGGTATPNFQPIYDVDKWLDGSRCHLVRR